MVAELGIYFLILTLVFSSFGFLQPIISYINKNLLIFSQEKLSVLIFTFTLLSFFCLAYSFIISDFSLNVVTNNSNTQLPTIYKITGVWGNHEGSILLWLLVMTFFGFLFSIQNIKKRYKGQNTLCSKHFNFFNKFVCSSDIKSF